MLNNTIKIAAVGTHGTGKSTTIYTLAKELKTDNKFEHIPIINNKLKEINRKPSIKLITEVASDCPFPINQETNLDAQLWMISNQMKQELENVGKYDFLLIDRSLYDYLSYTRYLTKDNNLYLSFIEIFSNIKYDLLIQHTINENYLREDGIRCVDKKFQKEIADILYRILICYYEGKIINVKECEWLH